MKTAGNVTHASLHHAAVEHFIEHGFAPEPEELADLLDAAVGDIERGLTELQSYHGVVLHPGSARIWVIHPFSTAPTNFVVKADSKEWWAPCAWCALGAAALLGGDVDIVTTLGATDSQAALTVRGGELEEQDFVVHFPTPMRRVWDNVIYSCSNMLLFNSESDVDQWVADHRIGRGDVQPLAVVWQLAKRWYGKHRDRNWRKWSVPEAREIFSSLGLHGKTWDLPETDDQF